jgi:DNA-(apurinic or apyrimidinic site) lyase
MNDLNIIKFAQLLQKIPQDRWDNIVRMEPECRYIGYFKNFYCFGGFAVLMILLELNSYQLKGKAETYYWYAIYKHLKKYQIPEAKDDLKEILAIFYKRERLPKGKLLRLDRFFTSSCIDEIWNSKSDDIVECFPEYWDKIAKVMKQKKTMKTICFAMKCFGVSILLSTHQNVNFSTIPIPVDSRITRFTEKTQLTNDYSPKNIQYVWNKVLQIINQTQPTISMIHLDSLIWQIGILEQFELIDYLNMIQLPGLASEINDFLSGKTT